MLVNDIVLEMFFFLSSIQFTILQWTFSQHNTLVKDVNAIAKNLSINSSSEKFVKFQGKEQRRSLLGDKVWASECCFSNFPRRLLTMLNFAASEIKFNNIMGLNQFSGQDVQSIFWPVFQLTCQVTKFLSNLIG